MLLGVCAGGAAVAQAVNGASAEPAATQAPAAAPTPAAATPEITLDRAIALAKTNEPGFAAAVAASRVSGLDRSIARAALLPNVSYYNQYIFSQSAGLGAANGIGTGGTSTILSPTRFIANNAIHEYLSEGVANETIGLQQVTAVSRADAAAAVAAAEVEIARRGLVASVVGLFYGSLGADQRLAVAQRAAQEAASFTKQTQEREAAREAAHADVVKAQLLEQQRERDVADAILQAQRSRLELGILLFPDPRNPFTLSAPSAPPPLPTREESAGAAMHLNPEIRSASSSLLVNSLDVKAARAAYLPDLGLNITYGIDAAQFAVNGRDGSKNLGYSASATLNIPIWDWLATQHRVRQAEILRDAAKTTLSATQRRLIAQTEEFYAEAQTARAQLDSLDLSVRTAAESLKLTRMRYTAGEATVLEVVDAQNSYTAAELARTDGTTRYQISLANLQLLTGTM